MINSNVIDIVNVIASEQGKCGLSKRTGSMGTRSDWQGMLVVGQLCLQSINVHQGSSVLVFEP